MRDAVAHFPRQVQPLAIVLEHVDDAKALLVVVEAAGHELVEHALAGVSERRVTQVVPQRDRLGQLLVELKHFRDGARDLRHLERVRQPRAIVIAGRREEHLGLVLQAAERLAVDDPVAVALKRRAHVVFRLVSQAAARLGAFRGLRRQNLPLSRFEVFSDTRHCLALKEHEHHEDTMSTKTKVMISRSATGNSCRASSHPLRNCRQPSGRCPQTWRECPDRLRASRERP